MYYGAAKFSNKKSMCYFSLNASVFARHIYPIYVIIFDLINYFKSNCFFRTIFYRGLCGIDARQDGDTAGTIVARALINITDK